MGCHELYCEWSGKRLRVVTFGGLRARRQLWIDAELADEVSAARLPFRYPLLCARVEVHGEFHDVDVVHGQSRPVVSRPPLVTVLVDGEVIYGDEYAGPRLLIEPRIWGRVRVRGFWAYAMAESPRGVLWLVPAILVLLLQGFELSPTIGLVSLCTVLAFVGLPLCIWLVNQRRWRSRARLLESAQTRAQFRKLEPASLEAQSLSSAVDTDRRVALPERA